MNQRRRKRRKRIGKHEKKKGIKIIKVGQATKSENEEWKWRKEKVKERKDPPKMCLKI